MTEQIFELLSKNPTLSILLGFVLAGFLAFLFRSVIASHFKKKYDLYDREEVSKALEKASEERLFYQKTNEKLTPTVTERVMKFLKHE